MPTADARAAAVAYLGGVVNADGSWGYLPGQPGKPEPTLLAAAAGATPALDWLGAHALGWGALLLPAALSLVPEAGALSAATVATLLTYGGAPTEVDPSLVRVNGALIGWPWEPGCFTWVEPTAYGMLSLRRTGQGDHPRVAQGELVLLDRQCHDGGWNFGNAEVRGNALTGDLSSTGWATIAVSDAAAVARGLAFMKGAATQPSASSLSLAILAHVAHRASFGDLADRLVARQRPDGSFAGRADWTALAACALGAADTGSCAFV